jgi:hypothetical protein
MKGTAIFLSFVAVLAAALSAQVPRRTAGPSKPFQLVEATIPEMRAAMASGRLTSRALVSQYLARLGMYEDRLHAAILVNPHALAEADRLDRERAAGKLRGPLHGIPVASRTTSTRPTWRRREGRSPSPVLCRRTKRR